MATDDRYLDVIATTAGVPVLRSEPDVLDALARGLFLNCHADPGDPWFAVHRVPLGDERDIEALVATDVGFRLIREKGRIECVSIGRQGSAWRLKRPRPVGKGRE